MVLWPQADAALAAARHRVATLTGQLDALRGGAACGLM